jgi:HEAT repeat protein
MNYTDVEKMDVSGDIEGLKKALEEKDWSVKRTAAMALGKRGDCGAIQLLLDELQKAVVTNDIDKQRNVAIALKWTGEPAVNPLIGIIIDKSRNQNFRWWAAETLVMMGKSVVEQLSTVLNSTDYETREYARIALQKIQKQ